MSFTDGFDPLKTDDTYSLSNENRTVLCDTAGVSSSAISAWMATSGKPYWEVKLDYQYQYYTSMGFCDQSDDTDFTKDIRSGLNESWAIHRRIINSRVYHDNAYFVIPEIYVTGDVLMFAVDIDAGKAWAGKNDVWWESGDPANGTNPLWEDATIIGNTISACVSCRQVGDKRTARFQSAQLDYAPPSGFSAPGGGGAVDSVVNQSMLLLF